MVLITASLAAFNIMVLAVFLDDAKSIGRIFKNKEINIIVITSAVLIVTNKI